MTSSTSLFQSSNSPTKTAFARMNIGLAQVEFGCGAVVSRLLNDLCLAKTLSVPEINSLRNFLNRKICYDYGPCSKFRDYV
jgi:hypothetical protein